MKTIRTAAALAACAALTAATPAAAKSQATRGFHIENHSSKTFVLKDVERVECQEGRTICIGPFHKKFGKGDYGWYAMGFDGRPDDGEALPPGGEQTFELYYRYTGLNHTIHYAAWIRYGPFSVKITTSSLSNDSVCSTTPPFEDDFTCYPEGRTIRIVDKR